MPIYESEALSREELYELRKRNCCQQCGGRLDVFLDLDSGKAFLACADWLRSHHEGIERAAHEYEPDIVTGREMMVEDLGQEKATKLVKYQGVVSLTREQAREILGTIWPDAPEVEVLKAAIICHQYGLNPLMKHVFLIPFKRRERGVVVGEDWVIVLGIKTNRLLAHRSGDFSYLDGTPRIMTEEEQKSILGSVDSLRIWAITKLKDGKGNEAPGYGSWPHSETPHGAEKGNTKTNMAFVRSERNALDRLFPGEMPQGIDVIDGDYAPPPSLISPAGGEKIGGAAEEGEEEEEPDATISSPPKGQPPKSERAPAELEGEGFHIDLTWLNESLKELNWSLDTAKTFLISQYHVAGTGTLEEVIKRLTREQAESFVHEIQNRLSQRQGELF